MQESEENPPGQVGSPYGEARLFRTPALTLGQELCFQRRGKSLTCVPSLEAMALPKNT